MHARDWTSRECAQSDWTTPPPHGEHGGETLAHVFPSEVGIGLLQQLALARLRVDGASQRELQTVKQGAVSILHQHN